MVLKVKSAKLVEQEISEPQCRCDKFTGSGVSHGVSQWKYVVLICTESDQLKTKSNPGKFLRKCSFSDF